MSLKLGKLRDRSPAKLTILLEPETYAALNDYAEVYETTYGKREEIERLAPVMIETFLSTDAGFKRARKEIQQRQKEEA